MFELLFKYPASVFAKGTFVLMGAWPRWALVLSIAAAASLLGWFVWGKRDLLRPSLKGVRAAILWGLQCALLALLLLMLWQPAISVTALRPQQNIVAVVVDDSRSMELKDGGASRQAEAVKLLNGGLLDKLKRRFQVRLYRLGPGVERVGDLKQLTATQSSTQIGKGLRQLADEAATLPIGSVVLLSDGADNSGGIDRQTLSELGRRRLPVNTVGFGSTKLLNDIELDAFDVPANVLTGSRLQGQVTLRQQGFAGKHARLILTADGRTLATRDIVLRDGPQQIETIEFSAKDVGVKNVEAKLEPLAGESNTTNNGLTRVLLVEGGKRRILYVEGEPRWEYKFLRRAAEDDSALQIVSMLRTTQNKIYRQGIANPSELVNGFPTKPEELDRFAGLILGSVESAFFTATQMQMIEDFVNRRGGGLLFLGGRWALSDGGYNIAPFSQLLPVTLPSRRDTFQRSFVAAELTPAGKDSLTCRIENDPEKSSQHWEILPYLADYQDAGVPKPGAVVLVRVNAGGKRLPLLVTENYGRGRTAVFATGGSWRWRMQQPVGDQSQETFWRQLLRSTVSATPSQVVASTPQADLEDDGHIQLRAEIRDKTYLPVSDADVTARIIGPDGTASDVPLHAEALKQGVFSAEWTAPGPGSYVAEVKASRGKEQIGSDSLTFRRQDGASENFHREQNKDLLEKLAAETGGRYYNPEQANKLPDEISYSEAGITAHEIKDLWDMPAFFLLALALRSTEWLLRRRWGVV